MFSQNFNCASFPNVFEDEGLVRLKTYSFIVTVLLLLVVFVSQAAKSSLILLGTAYDGKTGGTVLIKNKSTGQVKAFKRGNEIFGEGTLQKVSRYQAVIVKGDTQLTLFSKFNTPSVQKGFRIEDKVAVRTDVKTPPSFKEEGFERTGTESVITQQYRDRVVNNQMAKILMEAASEAVIRNGRVQGFRLFELDEDSLFRKMGLDNDDVVTHIEDSPLTSVTQTIRLLNLLKDTSTAEKNADGQNKITFQVLRNGKPERFSLRIR